MSEELMNMVYRQLRVKIENEKLTKSLNILLKRNVLFEDFSMYKSNPRHSFNVFANGEYIITKALAQNKKPRTMDQEVHLRHYIDDEEYDDILFYLHGNGQIGFEYHMNERAAKNVIHRKNYPEEWEMFSDEMPWPWIYEQFKILSIRCI
jgi:hypothetical protein